MAVSKNPDSRLWSVKKHFYLRKHCKFPMKKNGFFFTTIAIAFSIVLLISYNVYAGYRLNDKMQSVETRIGTMNGFIKDLENDAENAIFIAGFRSLLSIEDYMMKYDDFISNLGTNLNSAFDESFIYGAINSEKMSLMQNNTFLNWTNKMEEQAAKIDISLELTVNSVEIMQSSPWTVDVSVNLKIDATDKKNTASWVRNRGFTKTINITGFVDPLYLVNNDGKVNNTIRKTTVNPSSSTANLQTHMANSYYIGHTDAPSYLMRFENNLNPSAYGIESLVNTEELKDAGFNPNTRSAVDYIYYGTAVTSDCRVEGFQPYPFFRLDYLPEPPNHLEAYGAECLGHGDDD